MAAEQRLTTGGGHRSGMPALSDRLDALAFGLLAVMPLGMALINRSAQPILIAAMLAALAARASCGELAETRRRMERTLRRPLGLVCLAYLAFALVSITWGHHPRTSISMFAEVAGSAGAALVLHAALPRPVPSWAWKLAVAAMALGCVTILGELASGMAIRGSLGARNFVFIFKRSVTAMLVLFWPIAAYLWITGRRSIAGALLLLFAIAIYAAHSSGAAMGLAAGLALAGLAALSQRTASLAIAAALGLALAVAPVLGDAAERLLPERIVERLHFAHADQRLEVWQSFGEVVKRRPIGGAGFGTSTKMAQEPVAQEVPAERRVMLGAWHPHNGYLQIWAETGAVGALLAGAALMLLAFGIGRLPRPAAIATAALVASAAAVLLVGHGIWQGWWSAVIGTAAFWLARLPEPR